ncbi:MAG TPA: hypothetical protein VJ483_07920, partial [Holophagaceae bacterium]|nr:hypothetical protein [Holophagaceae bacterium]
MTAPFDTESHVHLPTASPAPTSRPRRTWAVLAAALALAAAVACGGGGSASGGSAGSSGGSGGGSGGGGGVTTPPTITTFAAQPATISAGQVSTLAWTVSNATSLSLNQGIGTVTGTTRGVSPATTTQYTLSATNSLGTVTASATVTVTAGGGTLQSPRILPNAIQNAILKATSADPTVRAQWTAFQTRLDDNLNQIQPSGGIYQGDVLEGIPDYALGYQVLKGSDPVRAAKYADKAIGLIKSGLHDFQKGTWITQQFLARGDGSTKTFTLPNADFDPSTLVVTLGPVSTTPVVKGPKAGQDDTGADYSVFLKVSKTMDGAADYAKDADWRHDGDWWETLVDWSLDSANQPATGSTYYVTSATPFDQPPLSYNSANPADTTQQVSADVAAHTIKLKTAPTAAQAVFIQYSYGTHAADYSSLAYQQTSMGDGGFNSGLIDTGYTSRYLGKDLAIGYDWLFGYPGFSPALKGEVQTILGKWYNRYRNHGYYYDSPSSNYGAGMYISGLMTMMALKDRANFTITDGSAANTFDGAPVIDPATNAPITLQADALAHRANDTLPILTGAITTTQKIGSLKGGFWAEGWNYGQQATRSILMTGLALEELGLVPQATEERAWAAEVTASLIHEQPDMATIYDGGDWYAYPAPFVGKELIEVLTAATADPAMRSYGNQILQHYPGAPDTDFLKILFNDPLAP